MYILALSAFLAGCARPEAPTGITQADVEGVWAGAFQNTALLGRSVSGDVDWLFDRRTFEIEFLNPPQGQATRISGDWKFANGRLVLTLRSSFPIGDDIGATDSLFVSILDNQMSVRTSRGSSILLRKIRSFADFFDGVQDRIIAENFFFPFCAENPLSPRQRLISVFLGEPRA